MLERHLELRRDPVEVRLQELRPEVPRRLERRPRDARLLVRPEEHRVAFLAEVELAAEVERHGHLTAGRRHVLDDLRHVVGHDVHVFHGEDRQLHSSHPAHLARPQAGRVDDVLGMDARPAIDVDVPGPVRPLPKPGHPGVPVDLGAGLAGGRGVGVRDAGRVDVPFDRVVQRANEVALFEEREQSLRLGRRDEFQVHAQVPAAGLCHPQEVHPDRRVGEHDPARQVDGAILPGQRLDLLVQLDRVLLQLGDIRVAVEGVHPAGRVPG